MSRAVQEVQARIAKLSADIDLQKEFLKQLERSKSNAQRELNVLRDPVAQLPLEISTEIFLQCLPEPPFFPTPGAIAAPMLLLNVCNTWTDIALSISALWAAIQIDSQPGVEILQFWLPRARDHPLSISLRGSLDYDVAEVLAQYGEQLKHLEIYDETFPIDVGTLKGFPRLETLIIGGLDEQSDISVLGSRIMGLLRLVPNLLRCTFHCIDLQDNIPDIENLILPNLRCLTFGRDDEPSTASGDGILKYISLPALETLAIPLSVLTFDEFSLFLERSSPPLQKLILGAEYGGHPRFTKLDQWLRLLPSLTYIDLFRVSMDDLFSALADSPSHLLPNLRTLTIRDPFSNQSYEPLYHTLLRALSARRTNLVCFHLTTRVRPGSDFCDGVRELVKDGMEIFIGYQYNFISA
ncbi:hypothetical protein B0H19DRAFT_1369955 [Mycena capillaripes]|nr:hypothetical protein B0H19DRAFT_1369955 [Mycena capillaripes]